MKKYLVVFEKTETSYSAYSPDVDGCIATGRTLEETKKLMTEAIKFHLKGMEDDRIAEPRSESCLIEI